MNTKQKGRRRTSFRSMLEGFLEEDREFRWNFEEEKIKLQLAEELDRVREERGLTQQDLAEHCRTTQSAISRFLNGQDTRSPQLDTLIKLADAVDMELRISLLPRVAVTKWTAPVVSIEAFRWEPTQVKEGPETAVATSSWGQDYSDEAVCDLAA